MNRSILPLVAAAVVVFVLAIGALTTDSHPVDACFGGPVGGPPGDGWSSGPDCQWYKDGISYSDMRRDGYPWYIVLTSMLIVAGAFGFVAWNVRDWRPGMARVISYITPGSNVPPRD